MGYLARATQLLEEYRARHGRIADRTERDDADQRHYGSENVRQCPLRDFPRIPPLVDAREVAWRVEAMRRQVSVAGPLPFFVARDVARGTRLCASCGDFVAAHPIGMAVRCNVCMLAVHQVVEECAVGRSAATSCDAGGG